MFLEDEQDTIMQILLIAPRFPAISETFVLHHALGLMERGIDVWVLSVPGDLQLLDGGSNDASKLRKQILPVAPLLGNGAKPTAEAIALLPRKYASLRLIGLTLFDLAVKRRGLGNRRTLSMARSLCKAPHFDLIHAQHGQSALSAARLINAGFLKGPLISTFHGTDLNVRRNRSNAFLYKPVWESSSLCTVGTKFMAQHLEKAPIAKDRYRIIPVGVDVNDFINNKRSKLPEHPLRLVTIGRLVPVKGTEYAIRAVRLLQERGVNVVLDIVGAGILLEGLKALVKKLSIANHVIFHGGLPSKKTREILGQADILVHPGIIDAEGQQEGQGLVLAEAQAMEVPVVASSVGGIPESVCAESAILVPQKCPKSIADAVKKLSLDPQLARQMGTIGRSYVSDNFNQEKILDCWIDVYRQLTDTRQSTK